jgi:Glycosyl hydrolase family 63 C-terminal domain
VENGVTHTHYLLSIMSQRRLLLILDRMLDETEFLSPYGIRSLSRYHEAHPFIFHAGGSEHRVDYEPGESQTWLFGGNSNWRGPIWLPLNYMIIESLERYYHYYGSALQVECPKGSGQMMNLQQVVAEISRRLCLLVQPDTAGHRPCHGTDSRYATDPHWRDLVLFYEYFHADTGAGLGASHQTGWTALLARLLEDRA